MLQKLGFLGSYPPPLTKVERCRIDIDTILSWWYLVGGGGFVAEVKKISIALAPGTMDKLDQLCAEKGVKRPAVISFAIDKLWKEEHADKEK